MKHLLTAALIAAAVPANAGGPIIITEDMTETAPMPRKSFKDAVPFILLGLVVAGIVLGGNGGTVCNNDEPGPMPEPCGS